MVIEANIVAIIAGTTIVQEAGGWDELQDNRGEIERLVFLARILALQAVIIVYHIPAIGNLVFDRQISDRQRLAVQWNANLNTLIKRQRVGRPNDRVLHVLHYPDNLRPC